jgi:hypothetical protein
MVSESISWEESKVLCINRIEHVKIQDSISWFGYNSIFGELHSGTKDTSDKTGHGHLKKISWPSI